MQDKTLIYSHLYAWYESSKRILPWRETEDPYAIWLSEVILQQTRVAQGLDYYRRFLDHWPTVKALSEANEAEVLREWQGLGYYSRARNLHAAAKQVVAMGGFPTTIEGLRALKGVGDYTAAAIGSFAFGLPAAVVDGNVYRVLSRHFGIATPINTTEGKKEFTLLAQSLIQDLSLISSPSLTGRVGVGRPSSLNREGPGVGLFNQGMMDFGATLCTPQSPQCLQCPLQETCVAFREGRVQQLPVKEKKLQVKERHLIYIYIRVNGYTALHRRPAGDIWQGLYEPWLTDEVPSGAVLLRQHVKHILTHRILYADFWLWELSERPTLPADYFWVKEEELDNYAVPRLIEKLFENERMRE